MRRTRLLSLTTSALAAAAFLIAAATPASASSLRQDYRHYPKLVSNYGTGPEDFVYGGNGRGYGTDAYAGLAHWYASGEHLDACDQTPDGHSVTAEIIYPDPRSAQSHVARVTDANGSKAGCSDLNLDLAEGTHVQIRVCVVSEGCTWYYDARA